MGERYFGLAHAQLAQGALGGRNGNLPAQLGQIVGEGTLVPNMQDVLTGWYRTDVDDATLIGDAVIRSV
jgi:hypothetical protein